MVVIDWCAQVSEFLDQVSNELHLSGEDAGTNQCLQQVSALVSASVVKSP